MLTQNESLKTYLTWIAFEVVNRGRICLFVALGGSCIIRFKLPLLRFWNFHVRHLFTENTKSTQLRRHLCFFRLLDEIFPRGKLIRRLKISPLLRRSRRLFNQFLGKNRKQPHKQVIRNGTGVIVLLWRLCSVLYFPITSHAKSYAMAMFKCWDQLSSAILPRLCLFGDGNGCLLDIST